MVPVDGEEAGEPDADAEDQGPDAGEVHAGHDETGEGRKRRRRGRRGGRRNRRGDGPVGQDAYPAHPDDEAPADEVSGMDLPAAESVPAIEPELATAIADFGGPAVPPHQPEEVVAASDAPRRRSTVREAVTLPVESSDASSPAASEAEVPAHVPEPAPEPASEADNKPRRTGWWAKRLLGGR
jgi:ribonuclease E